MADPIDQSLWQRLCLQHTVLFGGRGRERAAWAARAARVGCPGAPSQDENRTGHEALEQELPGRRTVTGLHRAAGGDGAAVQPADGGDLRGGGGKGASWGGS